ncbi:MAG: DgaE family pyridoxal phosphate-dependent ammonia lyase [Erysipelothrix sp.]|nr:DgaE family pyridoxal phosphate-dependent ammonia lyase [Erysipelothrix sp.]
MDNKIRSVINASGKMSILGTSTVSDAVASGMVFGAQHFFVMEEYLLQLENYIAKTLNYDAAKIVASAASGIVTTTAAVIGRDDRSYTLNPFSHKTKRREIIIPKGHNVNFGAPIETMIEMAGGIVVEAGYANECTKDQIIAKINENTAGILYIKSHHTVQKNMLEIEDAVALAKEHGIPLIVDAAAEEDFEMYNTKDIDLLIFSGSKALEGPSSGILVGKETMIKWTKHVDKGIGRAMKVTKEMASGLLVALDARHEEKQVIDIEPYLSHLKDTVEAFITKDPAGREIYRLAIKTSPDKARSLIQNLEEGNPAIYTRNYQSNQGIVEFDTRALTPKDIEYIIHRIKENFHE